MSILKDETIWCTQKASVLNSYIRKGFALDDDRLKELGGGGYWKELLLRICRVLQKGAEQDALCRSWTDCGRIDIGMFYQNGVAGAPGPLLALLHILGEPPCNHCTIVGKCPSCKLIVTE